MDEAVILLLLRLAASASLLSFMGIIVYYLWREAWAATGQEEARQRAAGRLVVVANDHPLPPTGANLPLTSPTTLGRSSTCTIPIGNDYASQEHATVIHRLGQWWLEDRQSRNGTLVNGDLVQEPVVLSSGDIISIGTLHLRLELD